MSSIINQLSPYFCAVCTPVKGNTQLGTLVDQSEIQINALQFQNSRSQLEENQRSVVERIVNRWAAMLYRGKKLEVVQQMIHGTQVVPLVVTLDKDLLTLDIGGTRQYLRNLTTLKLIDNNHTATAPQPPVAAAGAAAGASRAASLRGTLPPSLPSRVTQKAPVVYEEEAEEGEDDKRAENALGQRQQPAGQDADGKGEAEGETPVESPVRKPMKRQATGGMALLKRQVTGGAALGSRFSRFNPDDDEDEDEDEDEDDEGEAEEDQGDKPPSSSSSASASSRDASRETQQQQQQQDWAEWLRQSRTRLGTSLGFKTIGSTLGGFDTGRFFSGRPSLLRVRVHTYDLEAVFAGALASSTVRWRFGNRTDRLHFALALKILRSRDPQVTKMGVCHVERTHVPKELPFSPTQRDQHLFALARREHFDPQHGHTVVLSVVDLLVTRALRTPSSQLYVELYVRYPLVDKYLYVRSKPALLPAWAQWAHGPGGSQRHSSMQVDVAIEEISAAEVDSYDPHKEFVGKEEAEMRSVNSVARIAFNLHNVKVKIPKCPHSIFGRLIATDEYFPTAIGTFRLSVGQQHMTYKRPDDEQLRSHVRFGPIGGGVDDGGRGVGLPRPEDTPGSSLMVPKAPSGEASPADSLCSPRGPRDIHLIVHSAYKVKVRQQEQQAMELPRSGAGEQGPLGKAGLAVPAEHHAHLAPEGTALSPRTTAANEAAGASKPTHSTVELGLLSVRLLGYYNVQ
ncbi:unnamed protein product [Vitrella brassicaformis CCMP3155]|uniref:Uncharacterized protein n=1 Tax=Vitrella brassicaformis (strain CCMP3155) TaxID=1169540 RepID=A0A0G4E8R5_VITBC|nr:unnamed protein product [Vitrella brassicaformis CCMP3155]|eukprot:CEL91789.1 unnamed protein product [Vitrella brassicaformis CCMP3155]